MSFNGVNPSKVVIIGANGGMGRDLRRNLCAVGIAATGLDKDGGPDVMQEDVLKLSPKAIKLICRANLIVLAVPDQLAVPAAQLILPHVGPDMTFMDCTSVKSGYQREVANISSCAKMSINPLFGLGLDWPNRKMAVTRITDGPALDGWLNVFRRMGLTLVFLDADTHDRLSAEAQSATHAAIIAFFLSVSEESAQFATPPSQLMRLLSARMLCAEAHVYWSIQATNPFAKGTRHRLRDALDRLDKLVESDNIAEFQEIWRTQQNALGANLQLRGEQCRQVIEFMKRLEFPND